MQRFGHFRPEVPEITMTGSNTAIRQSGEGVSDSEPS